MTVRRVELRLVTSGFPEAGAELDKLDLKIDGLKGKLDLLGTKISRPKVELEGIDEALAKVTALRIALDSLGGKRVSASVGVSGSSGSIGKTIGDTVASDLRNEIKTSSLISQSLGAHSRTDKLLADAEKAMNLEPSFNNNSFGWFRRLAGSFFGLGGSGGGGAGGAASAGEAAGGSVGKDALSTLGGANNYLMGGGIGALIAAALSISPAVIPFGLGGLVGLGGAYGALGLGSRAHGQLLTLQQQLATAKGPQRAQIQQKIATLQKRYGPELGLYGNATSFGHDALGAFNQAIMGDARGPHGGDRAGTSFVSGLSGVFKQLGGFTKSMGPELGQMFRASIPFVQTFVKIMEQFAKAVMPAITQSMKEFKPYLPQMMQGFKLLSQGIADFIKDLGPGMRTSVTVFKALMDAVKGILIAVAYTADGLAFAFARFGNNVRKTAHQVAEMWDVVRHATAVAFDWIRHRIASGAHEWASEFDKVRHDIASIWDSVWNNTVGRVERGVRDVEKWFHGLPPGIKSALGDLGHLLWNAGVSIISGLLGGLVSKFSAVKNFVSGIAGWISSHKGPIEADRQLLVPHGMAIMEGLAKGLNTTWPKVQRVILGLGDQIQDTFGLSLRNSESWVVTQLEKDNKKLNSLAKARALIMTQIQNANAFRKSTKGGIIGAFDITSVTNAAGGAPDAGDVAKFLGTSISQIKTFADNIKKLAKEGLNPKLLRQIIAAGPIQGGPVAQALADASLGSIRNINREENEITSLAGQVGRVSSRALYFSHPGHHHGHHHGHRHEIDLKISAQGNDPLVKAIVHALRKDIKTNGGGNVQKYLGWGSA